MRDPDRGHVLTESLNLMTNSTRQVGARNGRYKVICTEKVEPGRCEFFDLLADPLEEFPLAKPAACDSRHYLGAVAAGLALLPAGQRDRHGILPRPETP